MNFYTGNSVVWLHAVDNWVSILTASVSYGKVQITICVLWCNLFWMYQSNKHRVWSTSSVAEFCPRMNKLCVKLSTDAYLRFVGSEDFKISHCKSYPLFTLCASSWVCCVVSSSWWDRSWSMGRVLAGSPLVSSKPTIIWDSPEYSHSMCT
jgi:hypothetical protein